MAASAGTPPPRSGYRTVQGIATSTVFHSGQSALSAGAVPVSLACAIVTSENTGSTAPVASVTR